MTCLNRVVGKTNQKQDGGNNKAGAYGLGMRDTCRADGDETYRRAKGVGVATVSILITVPMIVCLRR